MGISFHDMYQSVMQWAVSENQQNQNKVCSAAFSVHSIPKIMKIQSVVLKKEHVQTDRKMCSSHYTLSFGISCKEHTQIWNM